MILRDFLIAMSLIWIAVVTIILAIEHAYGDDNEEELGLCLRGYETHCQTWQEKMLERLEEWNIMKAMNESLATAERFDK